MSNFKGRTPVRSLLAVAVSSALASIVQLPAVAQAAEQLEEVVVTGSRIARDSNLTGASPVQTITSADIKLSGELDIADVLREQPALLTSTSVAGSVDGTFATSVGQSVLQLRGLGAERTLVLVDGRRHVSGVSGEQSVDIGSIPPALIERVEVLTGGASAVYGADAVTGVVNFILKDDFEGLNLNFQAGASGEMDGENFGFSGLFGRNFADGRGNFTVGLDITRTEGIRAGDRNFSKNSGIASDDNNPARRFQAGEIDAGATPNFDALIVGVNGSPYGSPIPSEQDFIDDYFAEFGVNPALTQSELDLINRAANAPARAIGPQRTFSISSPRGVITPADGSLAPGVDLDGNGIDDCQESFIGRSTGYGCWVNNDEGGVRPYQDGLIGGFANQFGGDGVLDAYDQDYLTPDSEKYVLNVTGRFDLTDQVRIFGEGKYVTQSVEFGGPLNTFNDFLTVAPDNPFIPASLAGVAAGAGGLLVSRDPTNLGPDIDKNSRETMRFVAGLEGELDNGWAWEVFGVYGEFNRRLKNRNRRIEDRYYAAIDAIDDGSGNAICRSDVSNVAPPTSAFPSFDSGFYTFNPGDGQCVPINLFIPPFEINQAAVDFVTATTVNEFELTQTVFGGSLTGELPFLELPGGAIGFAVGAEYREETSQVQYDPLVLGVLPVTTPAGNAGDLARDVSGNEALTFDGNAAVFDSDDDYDVWEIYGELSVPLLSGMPFVYDLTLDLAGRYSDYSTIGTTRTWSTGLSYSPVEDVRFRGTLSQAVRAPNIFELFNPGESAAFSPDDPCDINEIGSLTDPTTIANRQANCAADGLPPGFVDTNTGRFLGLSAGNPDLGEETADTITIGMVFQPSFLEGLTVTVDYWDIEISDAIQAVSDQDIVENCYDAAPGAFPNQFCSLFTRDPATQNLNFLLQTELNFASTEAAGYDFTANYQFDALGGEWMLGVQGTYVDKIDDFFDPRDPTAVDPELGEIQRPEWAGQGNISYRRGPVMVRWNTMYQDEQLFRGAEAESFTTRFGPDAQLDEFYSHDLSFTYDHNESIQVYGGISNLTDEDPFDGEGAWPVSPIGRSFFLGVSYQGM